MPIIKPLHYSPLVALVFPFLMFSGSVSAESYYCGKNSMFISPGMSQAQVIQACGEPQSKQKRNQQGSQQRPVTQMQFSIASQKKAGAYGAFPISVGRRSTLDVTVANGKIVSLSLAGQSSQSISVCGSANIYVGGPSSALSACGSPNMTNKTFVNVSTGQSEKVEMWTIKPDQYTPGISLTFVNGVLKSINK